LTKILLIATNLKQCVNEASPKYYIGLGAVTGRLPIDHITPVAYCATFIGFLSAADIVQTSHDRL